MNDVAVSSLTELGFTELEAQVYLFLLQESPATGYRIAQAIGRLPANTYKAIETLETRGAVLIDQGASRLCRAVPSGELLSLLRRRFLDRQTRAEEALATIQAPPKDDRVYQLRSLDQVFERCRTMLAQSTTLVLMDAFPYPLEALRPDLEAAAKRGVQVVVKAFRSVELDGVEVILNPRGEDLMTLFPGQWLILLADGSELLTASVDPEEGRVRQAIWSGSATLSYMFHCSYSAEIMLAALFNFIDSGATLDELRAAIAPFTKPGAKAADPPSGKVGAALARYGPFYARTLPGYAALMEQAGLNVAPAEAESALAASNSR